MFTQIITSIALPNKYTKWYLAICHRAQIRATSRADAKLLLPVVEGHHILPKSFNLGGLKEPTNIAYLTTEEHFIVHHLATKMFSGKYHFKMIEALGQFKQGRAANLNAKQIAIIIAAKSSPCSPERKTNISLGRSMTEKLQCPHCNKLVDRSNYARWHNDNCRKNPALTAEQLSTMIKNAAISSKKSYEVSKLRGTHKPFVHPVNLIITCPHCLFTGSNHGAMMRSHFDRCIKNPAAESYGVRRPPTMRRLSCLNCHKETDSGNFAQHHGVNCKSPTFFGILLPSSCQSV